MLQILSGDATTVMTTCVLRRFQGKALITTFPQGVPCQLKDGFLLRQGSSLTTLRNTHISFLSQEWEKKIDVNPPEKSTAFILTVIYNDNDLVPLCPHSGFKMSGLTHTLIHSWIVLHCCMCRSSQPEMSHELHEWIYCGKYWKVHSSAFNQWPPESNWFYLHIPKLEICLKGPHSLWHHLSSTLKA